MYIIIFFFFNWLPHGKGLPQPKRLLGLPWGWLWVQPIWSLLAPSQKNGHLGGPLELPP